MVTVWKIKLDFEFLYISVQSVWFMYYLNLNVYEVKEMRIIVLHFPKESRLYAVVCRNGYEYLKLGQRSPFKFWRNIYDWNWAKPTNKENNCKLLDCPTYKSNHYHDILNIFYVFNVYLNNLLLEMGIILPDSWLRYVNMQFEWVFFTTATTRHFPWFCSRIYD